MFVFSTTFINLQRGAKPIFIGKKFFCITFILGREILVVFCMLFWKKIYILDLFLHAYNLQKQMCRFSFIQE